jgi:hypothetical protein
LPTTCLRKKYSSDAANLTSEIAAADFLSEIGLIFSLQVDAPQVAFPMPEFGPFGVRTLSLVDTSNGSPSVSTTMVQAPDSPRAAVTPIIVADSPSPDAQIESGCCFMFADDGLWPGSLTAEAAETWARAERHDPHRRRFH